ncbi:expressed unknown protein [Seminavis robusta]|uniref:Uncharacterized protein n=1 Tax=Seminavis robusta TaxID=568900 RepID=A0A9N8DZW2_9STRA|nr:expressed unknown protein [Seminavis robusta]|eukprot:Sro425_g140220.1 n/a (284) ;mRNA; f:54628-55479
MASTAEASNEDSKPDVYSLESLWKRYMEEKKISKELPNGGLLRPQMEALIDQPNYKYLKKHILKLQEQGNKEDICRILKQLAQHELAPGMVPLPLQPRTQHPDVQTFFEVSSVAQTSIDVDDDDSLEVNRSNSSPESVLSDEQTANNGNANPHDSTSLAERLYERYLRAVGWETRYGLIIPATLRDLSIATIMAFGENGVHCADDEESLLAMFNKYGEVAKDTPEGQDPVLLDFDPTHLVQWKQEIIGEYDRFPSNIGMYETLLKLARIRLLLGLLFLARKLH